MVDLYKQDVIDPGDRASRLAKKICYESHRNNPAVLIIPHQPGNFRGPIGFIWKGHLLHEMMKYTINGEDGEVNSWIMCQQVENDGAGGKPQFFTLVGTPETFYNLGWEIITMTADDFSRSGRYPAVIDNEIQTKYITDKNYHLFEALMNGYGDALRQANLVNITGEIAIMKHSITAFCDTGGDDQLILTWGASCMGLAHRDLLIDGSKIGPDMPIVGFWEPGYRCNGGTFFTNLIMAKWGNNIEKIRQNKDAMEFIKKLTVPSQSYAKTISRLLGWDNMARGWPIEEIKNGPMANITGIAHITGGGIWGKFKEILPPGIGAYLYSMPKPADVLWEAQEISMEFPNLRLSDYMAHSTLHGGCGMMVIAATEKDAIIVVKEAEKDGIQASIVGYTKSEDEINIMSEFKEKKFLSSLRPE